MIEAARQRASATAVEWLAFLANYNACDAAERQVAYRIRERVFGELYRRERTAAEWIDLGGES